MGTIEVAKGNVINIHFTDFELESPDQVDYVEITDGDGTLLGHFGANHFPNVLEPGEEEIIPDPNMIHDLTSITETVHVLFHTDSSITRRGWRLEWSSAPKPSEEVDETEGVLTSPNFGVGDYPNDLHYKQTIKVETGKAIKIHFTDWNVESLPTSGSLSSPNFPSNYANDLHERKTIEVAKGNVINIHFTDFELESPDQVDYVE